MKTSAVNGTVIIVIFPGGEILQNFWQYLSREGNFQNTDIISFIKSYEFIYFPLGEFSLKRHILLL